jgi:uncharacterized protein (TIGR01777 family)
MKILVTGATGFIGSHLTARLKAAGHTVLVVSRRADAQYSWSDQSLARGVANADAVVHLAGENLTAKRWTAAQKKRLQSSRFENTAKLASIVAAQQPKTFVSASAIGFYGANADDTLDERSPRGDGFLAELCEGWEQATTAASRAGVRTAIVRTGIVLGHGGALQRMLLPFKLGIGGPVGDGKQWMSWVHIDDLAALYIFLIEHAETMGVYNGTAPNPVTMKTFAAALGRALHRPAVLPVPGFVLKVAMGEVADVVLTGQKVLPVRTEQAGFRFRFTDIDSALRAVVAA